MDWHIQAISLGSPGSFVTSRSNVTLQWQHCQAPRARLPTCPSLSKSQRRKQEQKHMKAFFKASACLRNSQCEASSIHEGREARQTKKGRFKETVRRDSEGKVAPWNTVHWPLEPLGQSLLLQVQMCGGCKDTVCYIMMSMLFHSVHLHISMKHCKLLTWFGLQDACAPLQRWP